MLQSVFRPSQLIVKAVFLLALSMSARAEVLRFHIEDGQGAPLANAVILLPGTVTTPSDKIAVMDQINKTFVPHVLVIQQGQQVQFPNSDNIRHHVYSFSPVKPFELKLYAGVPEKPIQFGTAGIVVLGCNIHDSMVGYIVVADTPAAQKSDADGNLQLDVEPVPTSLRVWHEYLAPGQQTPESRPLPAADANGIRTIILDVTPPPPPVKSKTFGNRFGHSHGE